MSRGMVRYRRVSRARAAVGVTLLVLAAAGFFWAGWLGHRPATVVRMETRWPPKCAVVSYRGAPRPMLMCPLWRPGG